MTFAAERIESANAHVLIDESGCVAGLLGAAVVGWRPASDGIDLVGPDRLSVGFFSFAGDGSATLQRGATTLTLRRER